MLTDKEKNILIEIAKKHKLKLLILFGSRAQNQEREDSDWDFAYLTNKPTYKKDFNLKKEIMNLLNIDKLDLICLNKIGDYLLEYEIYIKGIKIYENENQLFDELKIKAWQNYQDFLPHLLEQDKAIKKSLIELASLS